MEINEERAGSTAVADAPAPDAWEMIEDKAGWRDEGNSVTSEDNEDKAGSRPVAPAVTEAPMLTDALAPIAETWEAIDDTTGPMSVAEGEAAISDASEERAG